MSTVELPLLFCDSVSIGVIEGSGESVQLTFHAPIAPERSGGAVTQAPVVRVAMTKQGFMALATAIQETIVDGAQRASARKPAN